MCNAVLKAVLEADTSQSNWVLQQGSDLSQHIASSTFLQSMDDETSGWFTLSEGTLMVWEGVCALFVDDDVQLFKIRSGKILSITLHDLEVREVSSDGYWSCAEVIGHLTKEKGSFYYHADSPENACLLLKHLAPPNVCVSSLVVRLDPDPLRCRNTDWISERIATWSQFGRRFCNDARIVLDSNMPL